MKFFTAEIQTMRHGKKLLQQRHNFFSSCSHLQYSNGTKLPLLETLVTAIRSDNPAPLKKTAVFYVHHALQSSCTLLESLLALGCRAHNIFVLDKHYSRCQKVVQQITDLGIYYHKPSRQTVIGGFATSFTRDINWLWLHVIHALDEDIEEVLILDHGGHALIYVPEEILSHYKVIGLEKTTGGLINLAQQEHTPPFPIINVAGCAVKKYLESPLIADAVVAKLTRYLPIQGAHLKCTILGYGAIGQALAVKLHSLGHRVIVRDTNPEKVALAVMHGFLATPDLVPAIGCSDYIFGCSGQDIARNNLETFRLTTQNKTLISCTSEDREFLSLLQAIPQKRNKQTIIEPLKDLEYQTAFDTTLKILNGGFPVNFDSSGESVPAQDIQLTRALVLAGVMQAIDFCKEETLIYQSKNCALDPAMQLFVAREWLQTQPKSRFSAELRNNFMDLQWINRHSDGVPSQEHTKPAIKRYAVL